MIGQMILIFSLQFDFYVDKVKYYLIVYFLRNVEQIFLVCEIFFIFNLKFGYYIEGFFVLGFEYRVV